MSIETVVIAVGRDEGARADRFVEIGEELAECGASFVVAHVFRNQETADKAAAQLDLQDGSASDVARRLESVRRVRKGFDAAGVDYEVEGLVGDPGKKISELTGDVGANRVVVGGRQRSPTGKAVFGSTAQDILMSAQCPVTFVRRED
jgi:nucleotide-binding universal stress UspA family protein